MFGSDPNEPKAVGDFSTHCNDFGIRSFQESSGFNPKKMVPVSMWQFVKNSFGTLAVLEKQSEAWKC